MEATLQSAPPPVPKPMSEIGRLTGVFFSPSEAFADIVRRPRWWIPMILIGILTMVFLYLFGQHVGWEHMLRQQAQRAAATQDLTPAQVEQRVAISLRFVPMLAYIAPIFSLIGCFLVSAVLMFLTNSMAGTNIKVKTMMGIVSYSYLPSMLNSIVAGIVMFLKDPEDFDLQNPTMFNLGVLLPADASRALTSLLSSLDLFSFWIIFLIATGLCAAATKLKMGKALTIVILPWAIYVAGRALLTAATS